MMRPRVEIAYDSNGQPVFAGVPEAKLHPRPTSPSARRPLVIPRGPSGARGRVPAPAPAGLWRLGAEVRQRAAWRRMGLRVVSPEPAKLSRLGA